MNKKALEAKLSEFLIDLQLEEFAKRTLKKYEGNVRYFIETINHDRNISKTDLIRFKEHLLSGKYKPTTINNYIITVNKFMKYCLGDDDMTLKNLRTQTKNSLEEVVSLEDYKRLVRFAKRMGREDIMLIMKIITRTGIRIGELKDFTVESISKSFYIHTRNKGKEKDIPVPQDLVREIRKYCKKEGLTTGPIFQIVESTIWRQMKRIAGYAKISLKKVHAHSFRHLFAKEYMNQYNNLAELADHLGHSSLNTTSIYTRTTQHEKRKRLEAMKF